MIREGLEALAELVRRASDCRIIEVPGDPSHVFGVFNRATGELVWREKSMSPRDHELNTLDDFVAAVKAFRAVRKLKADEADDSGLSVERDNACRPSVFCGSGTVRAVLDEPAPRRETVYMDLDWSSEFMFLNPAQARCADNHVDVEGGRDHAAFINMLRIDLGQAVDPADVLAFRNLSVTTGTDTGSVQEQGRASLTKVVQERIALGEGNSIPEELTLRMFVYNDLVEPVSLLLKNVRVAVIVNMEEGKFILRPISGELERAQRETDAYVRETVAAQLGDVARVFCGAV